MAFVGLHQLHIAEVISYPKDSPSLSSTELPLISLGDLCLDRLVGREQSQTKSFVAC